MYRLRSKLVSLLAQASVFVQAKKTLAYYKICPFSVNYESKMFYGTGPRAVFTTLHFLRNLQMNPISYSVSPWRAFSA